MIWLEPIVTSASDLERKGFSVEPKEESGTIYTVQFSIRVPTDTQEERYIRMECIVTDREVAQEWLERVDSAGESVRTTVKEGRSGSFTLVGRELSKSYFVFRFKCPDARGIPHERKYLVSAVELAKNRANQSPQTSRAFGPRG